MREIDDQLTDWSKKESVSRNQTFPDGPWYLINSVGEIFIDAPQLIDLPLKQLNRVLVDVINFSLNEVDFEEEVEGTATKLACSFGSLI